MRRVRWEWVVLLLATATGGCGGADAGSKTLHNSENLEQSRRNSGWVLRIGSVSKFPKKGLEIFQPLQDYLTEALRPYGLTECETVVCDSVEQMAERMEKG